jgi:hypothetical protein
MSMEHVKAACGFGAAMAAHLVIVGENDAPDEQFGRHRRFGVSFGVPGRETCVRIFKGRPFVAVSIPTLASIHCPRTARAGARVQITS